MDTDVLITWGRLAAGLLATAQLLWDTRHIMGGQAPCMTNHIETTLVQAARISKYSTMPLLLNTQHAHIHSPKQQLHTHSVNCALGLPTAAALVCKNHPEIQNRTGTLT